MTKTKSIIAFFILLSGLMFIGESHTFFLENFQDEYVQVGYYLETGDSEIDMRNTILAKANEFDTEVFAIQKEGNGAFSRQITIYSNEVVQNTLQKDWGIKEGSVSSFFSGKTTFIFKPFEQATEKELQNCWYIGKSTVELHTMLFPHMVDYSGNFRNTPSEEVSEKVVAATWIVMSLAIFLLTYYDTIYSKKEHIIRVVLGADFNRLKARKIAIDTVGLCIAILAAIILLYPFTSVTFRWNISIIGAFVLLGGNAIVLVAGMKMKQRIQIKSVTTTKKVLYLGVTFKGLVSALAIILLSITLALLVEGMKLYSQKDYYNTQNNRVHIDVAYPYDYEKMEFANGEYENNRPIVTWEQLVENFMRFSYRELDFSLMSYRSFENVSPKWGDKYVIANLAGINQYKNMIPDWETIQQKAGNYILVPEHANKSEIVKEILENNLLGLNEQTGIFTYNKGLSVIAEGHLDEFDYSYKIKNPVILLDTYDYGALPNYPVSYQLKNPEESEGLIAKDFAYLSQFVSMENREGKLEEFAQLISGEAINPNLLEFTIIDIEEWFEGLWALQNRSLLISVILTVLVLILAVQISALVLKIAYETNARELTIKKVMGYTLMERFKLFFLLTIAVCGLSFICAIILKVYLGIGVLNYLAFGSTIVFGLDVSILLYLMRKNDHMQIQKVLKGGI